MRYIHCTNCNKTSIPLNDSIDVEGKHYCIECFESKFTDENLTGKNVKRNVDPTICAQCAYDSGSLVLEKISTYPICDDCNGKLKKVIFPTWVKAFLVGITVIIVFSFIWNWRFYSSFANLKQSNTAFASGNYTKATTLLKAVVASVPENKDIQTLYAYENGVALFTAEKYKEAIDEFNKCAHLPPDYGVSNLITQSNIGLGFDCKDYNLFLSASKQNLQYDTTIAMSWASVASAYACIYAEKGQDSTKHLALRNLHRAQLIDSISGEMKQYYNLIDYRITKREIIPLKEFIKLYPNGWLKN